MYQNVVQTHSRSDGMIFYPLRVTSAPAGPWSPGVLPPDCSPHSQREKVSILWPGQIRDGILVLVIVTVRGRGLRGVVVMLGDIVAEDHSLDNSPPLDEGAAGVHEGGGGLPLTGVTIHCAAALHGHTLTP